MRCACRSYTMTLSIMQVLNEVPYLVEHIEFMRVLGVNRVVVCDDGSTDNTTALQVDAQESDGNSTLLFLSHCSCTVICCNASDIAAPCASQRARDCS